KYEEINIKPLVLEQLEAKINLAGTESNLFICEYKLKKLAGIPLGHKISLDGELLFEDEKGTERFLNSARKNILPFYDPQAGINEALNTINAFRAAEIKETAFRGFNCQFVTECRGEDLRVFKNPDLLTAFICSVPFGGNEARNIEKAQREKDRFDAELKYAKTLKELDELKTETGVKSKNDKLLLRRLKLDRINLESQHKLTEKFVKLGTKEKRELAESKMRLTALALQADMTLQDYVYNEALNEFLCEMDGPVPLKKDTFIISGLQDALELAEETSDELKSLKNKLGAERNMMDYINSVYFSGSFKTNYVEEKINEADEIKTKIESFVFIAGVDAEVSFISGLMKKEQEMKVEMSKLEVERAKLDIAQDIIKAYAGYLESMAILAAVNERYYREKETLESMEEQMKTGIRTRMEYLKQEQVVSLVQAKLIDSKKTVDTNKKHLEIAVGSLDPRFTVMNLEVFDRDKNVIIPADSDTIKMKLDREIKAVREILMGPLAISEARYGEFEEAAARYAARAASRQIKSLLINVSYSYLTKSLSEITDFEEEILDLPLLTEDAVQEFREFVTASASLTLYDPGISVSGRIKSVDEKIAALKARDDIVERTQDAQRLLDAYETALRDFDYAASNLSRIEHEMESRFDDIRKTGKMDLTEELKVLGMLLQMKIERVEAFYGVVSASNRIDQYLRKYVDKGLDDILNMAEPEINKDTAALAK
ncbi:MAG: TolC family protein, partial [bacterium]|nr:TolC family protein [bacterium]